MRLWPTPLVAPSSVSEPTCDRLTVTLLDVVARVTLPRLRLVNVTPGAETLMSYRGRAPGAKPVSPVMVRLSRLTLTVPTSGLAPGSTMTVPLVPAAGIATASEWKWVASTGESIGVTQTVDIRERSSSHSMAGRNRRGRGDRIARENGKRMGPLRIGSRWIWADKRG